MRLSHEPINDDDECSDCSFSILNAHDDVCQKCCGMIGCDCDEEYDEDEDEC